MQQKWLTFIFKTQRIDLKAFAIHPFFRAFILFICSKNQCVTSYDDISIHPVIMNCTLTQLYVACVLIDNLHIVLTAMENLYGEKSLRV